LAFVAKYADLIVSGEDDPAIPIRKLGDLTDVLLGHTGTPPSLFPARMF
jgi:hypothetical protein